MELFDSLWTSIHSGRNFGTVEIPSEKTTSESSIITTEEEPLIHVEIPKTTTTEDNTPDKELAKDEFPEAFKADLEALSLKFGHLDPGMTISIELQELLQIAPRQRKRSDAYHKLQGALKKYLNVELLITSRKKNGYKNKI